MSVSKISKCWLYRNISLLVCSPDVAIEVEYTSLNINRYIKYSVNMAAKVHSCLAPVVVVVVLLATAFDRDCSVPQMGGQGDVSTLV